MKLNEFISVMLLGGFALPAIATPTAPVKTLLQLETFDEIPSYLTTNAGVTAELDEEYATIGDKALKVTFDANKRLVFESPQDWSQIAEQHAALSIDVTNITDSSSWIVLQIDLENGEFVRRAQQTVPGESMTLYLSLNDYEEIDRNKVLGFKNIPAKELKVIPSWSWMNWGTNLASADKSKITGLRFYSTTKTELVLDNLRIIPDFNHESAYANMIDGLGQNNFVDYEGKIKNPSSLGVLGEQERGALGKLTNRNRYGGNPDHFVSTANCKLSNPRSFNACKEDGRWYLVDPDGNAFFSHGLANIRITDTYTMTGLSNQAPSETRQSLFADIPENYVNNNYGPAHDGAIQISGVQKKGQAVNFYANNRDKRHGGESQWISTTINRLHDWGFNTLANWTDPDFYAMTDMPFVVNGWTKSCKGCVELEEIGPNGYWGKLPDPFTESFANNAQKMAEQIADSIPQGKEHLVLGIFVDNEMSWEDTSNPDYTTAIGTSAGPKTITQVADQYYRIVKTALANEGLGNYLYLGSRFAADWGVHNDAVLAAANYVDVMSFNVYKNSITQKDWSGFGILNTFDLPVIIGEFHFGSLEGGNFARGQVGADTQKERAELYKAYMDSAISHQKIVGAHWFQYIDSPITGRAWDGENYNIGFVNTVDTPYTEMTDMSRVVGCELYGDNCLSLANESPLYTGKNIGVDHHILESSDPISKPSTKSSSGGGLGIATSLLLVIMALRRRN